MSYATQRTAAIADVVLYAQTTIQPTLSTPEVEGIVDSCVKATIWTVNTPYAFGAVILPTVRNGRRYICIQSGTSDATTEPEWSSQLYSTIQDGNSDPVLTWREDGPDFANVFDVRGAIHTAWTLKAAKASLSVDVQQQVGGLKASQIYDHCLDMAAKYAPVEIA